MTMVSSRRRTGRYSGTMNSVGFQRRTGRGDYGCLNTLQVDPYGNITLDGGWGDYNGENRRFRRPGGAGQHRCYVLEDDPHDGPTEAQVCTAGWTSLVAGFLDGTEGRGERAGLPVCSAIPRRDAVGAVRLRGPVPAAKGVSPFVTKEQVLAEDVVRAKMSGIESLADAAGGRAGDPALGAGPAWTDTDVGSRSSAWTTARFQFVEAERSEGAA